LPHPDGPTSASVSPCATENERPSRTGRPGVKLFTTSRNSIAGSRRTSRVFGISDYSTSSARAAGEGWVLVGDAATFLDPVFSTGVFLAMAMGERAAKRIDRALQSPGTARASDLLPYAREANRLVGRFRRFVYAFYDPVFFEAFCSKEPVDRMRAAITTVLSGGIERISLSARIWMEVVFLSVAIDRFRRRLGLGPKPQEAAA
jgi:hypothetical protein